jgi:hypothetical protein
MLAELHWVLYSIATAVALALDISIFFCERMHSMASSIDSLANLLASQHRLLLKKKHRTCVCCVHAFVYRRKAGSEV